MNAFIGVDWGTTNLRAWRIDNDGTPQSMVEAPLGVSAIARDDFANVFARVVHEPLGADLPALLCGMVGSNIGWRQAPYIACPVALGALSRHVIHVGRTPAIAIVPGLSCRGLTQASDLMRGEETQILGWLAQDATRHAGQRLVCLPGTHSKWVIVRDGAVERFVTAMTGELFAILSTHSVLKTDVSTCDEEAFAEGLDAAGDGDALAIKLFSARARIVADGARPDTSSSYLSGLLIGSEIAAARRVLAVAVEEIALIGAPPLTALYALALGARGARVSELDGGEAVRRGLYALAREGALQ
jgi:2-dehydro-3-deoxygalactonokinase